MPFGEDDEILEPTFGADDTAVAVEERDFLEQFITSDKPIEEWLPQEQAGVAKQILDSFDKPDDERARISNAVMLSGMFGTPLDVTITMQPEMMREVFGKPLSEVSGEAALKRLHSMDSTIGAMPEAKGWQKFKEFFTGKPGQGRIPLPPDADRIEKVDRAIDTYLTFPLRTFLKFAKGRAFGVADIAWAGLKKMLPQSIWDEEVKNMNLDQAMDWAFDYDPSGFAATMGEVAEFAGRIQTVHNIGVGSGLLGNLPKSVGVFGKALEAGKLGLVSGTINETVAGLAEMVDPGTDYSYEGASGAVKEAAILMMFNLGKTLALEPLLNTTLGRSMTAAVEKWVAETSLKYPQLLDLLRKNPSEKTLNELREGMWQPVKDVETGLWKRMPFDFARATPAERALVRHAARAIETYNKRLWQAYMRSPTPDIVFNNRFRPAGHLEAATTLRLLAEPGGQALVAPAAATIAPVAKPPAEGITVPPKAPAAAVEPVGAKVPKEPAIIIPEQIQKGKPFKPVSKKGPGLTKAEQEVLTAEQQEQLRFKQTQGEKAGFKAGEKASQERAKTEILKLKKAQKMTEGRRKTAVELVKAFIEKENRGDFLKRVSVAKTPRDMEKITEAIEKGVIRAEKKLAIGNLKKAAKAISPKKMLPEFAETTKKILDSIQIGKIRPETIVKNTELKEMAQQVLDTAREDSVAAFQAQQLLSELRGKTTKTFAINQLSVEAIDQITDTLIALRFQNEADTIAAKDENATEAVRRRKEIKKGIVEAPEVSAGGKQLKKFKLFHDNLESALDAVAGARPGTYDLWVKDKKATTEFIYDKLNKGVDDQIIHNEKARNIFRQILSENGVTQKDILNWSMRPEDVSLVKKAFGIAPKPEVYTFILKDAKGKATEFEFTTNELMSIFMHSRNSHNLAVLLNDGMDRFIRGKKQKIRDFTVEVIDDMTDSLTAQQKKVARQVGSKLMDGFNKDSINETSVRLEFFELAKVENYWPARRSIIRTPRGKQVAGAVKTVEGMGLLKERIGVGNPMRLSGFFETTYSTNKNVATYVGLAEPLREAKSVYTTDVIESMENSGRAEEAKLITDLIVRFEDQSALLGPLDTIIKRMLGGFAKAKLFLNLKIAPRQQISSFLISAYVDIKYIAEFKGIADKETIEEINKLSPQMKARFENLQFDRDIGDAFMQNELMNYLTSETTLIDKTALGMRFFDRNAIVDIYRAVKAEVIDKGVNINSKEGKALLKDRFEWVVRHTQPMWHPKDRSLIGSDPRPLVRSLTMFMSQREQLVRMVNNSITDYVNSEKTPEDATRLGRSIGAVTLSMTAFTLYNFAWAVLIHKKKRDVLDLAKSFFKDILSLPFFGKYIAKSFEIVFNILTDKPVFRQSFDEGPIEGILGRILIEAIPNFARAATHYTTGEKYKSGPNKGEEKWKNELLVATDALVDAIASLKGIPYYGAKDIARSVRAQLPEDEKKAVILGD